MSLVTVQLEELTCPSCIQKINKALGNLKGVSEVKVLFNLSKVKISYNETMITSGEIKKTIKNLGFEVLK